MNDYTMSRAWEEIHLDKFENNIKSIKNHLNNKTMLMAVIKADAYGHGVIEIAKSAEKYADYLAVACIEEAKQLRRHGIKLPILILGATPIQAVPDLFEYDIIPTVFEETLPQKISEYAKETGKKLKVHIKIDTGMGRLGFCCYHKDDNRAVLKILEISKLYGIEIEGAFTHFACADEETGKEMTHKQFDNFMWVMEELSEKGLEIPVKHCSNSAAIALYPNMNLDMVRAGIILYGEYPSEFVKKNTTLTVFPVKELKATVSQVKNLEKGKGISYGQHYETKKDGEKLATVCVGYADSYFRSLSGKARVLINGKFAHQVGNICMDQMVVDVSDIEDVGYGTEVVLCGKSGDNFISFSEIASILGTINYEVMCDVGKRLVKAYFYKGEFIKTVNYLEKL